MENIDAFEVLLGLGILWLAYLSVYIVDLSKPIINNKKEEREHEKRSDTQ